MAGGKEVIAALIYAAALALFYFNPVTSSPGYGSMVGLAAIAFLGAMLLVGGLSGVPSFYFLPLLGLAVFDLRAVGIVVFILLGMKSVSSGGDNMVVPKVSALARPAFSGYSLMILLSVAFILPGIQFSIPEGVMGFASRMLVPAIGCELEYTGQECVDLLVSKSIDVQCKGDATCISLLNSQRSTLEERTLQQLSSQIPGFSLENTVGESVQSALKSQIDEMIAPYQRAFQFIMAVVIFSAFQFLLLPYTILAGLVAGIVLRLLIALGLVTKSTKKVDKVIFEA